MLAANSTDKNSMSAMMKKAKKKRTQISKGRSLKRRGIFLRAKKMKKRLRRS